MSDAEKIGAKQVERGSGDHILNRRQEKKTSLLFLKKIYFFWCMFWLFLISVVCVDYFSPIDYNWDAHSRSIYLWSESKKRELGTEHSTLTQWDFNHCAIRTLIDLKEFLFNIVDNSDKKYPCYFLWCGVSSHCRSSISSPVTYVVQ